MGESIINHPIYHSVGLLEAQVFGHLQLLICLQGTGNCQRLQGSTGWSLHPKMLEIVGVWRHKHGLQSVIDAVLQYKVLCQQKEGLVAILRTRNSPIGGLKGKCKGCERAWGFQKGEGFPSLGSRVDFIFK